MAPSPEHDKEPKAPDKSHSQISDNSSSDIQVPVVETQQYLDTNSGATGGHTDPEESGKLENLDEGQLRALLDEAVTYKRPKDREGKSSLFKELLHKVEQDSEEDAFARGGAARRERAARGRRGARPLLAHSGSLQDLAAEGAPAPPRQPRLRCARGPVSARTHQGGSLPANVDQHNFGVSEGRHSFLEDVGGREYIATVCCVNPLPLGARREPEEYMLLELGRRALSPPERCFAPDDLDTRSSGRGVKYKSCATLEMGAHEPSPARVEPITTLAASPAVTSVTSATPQPIITSSHYSGLNILPAMIPRSDIKKSLDENGNSVQTVNASHSSSGQHSKKPKRKQKKNETETLSDMIDGYRGCDHLDVILKFIESNTPDSGKHKGHHRPTPSKGRDDKKRSTERRTKDTKMDKLKKSNSMEELSRSKLDDLTSSSKDSLSLRKSKKQSTFDQSEHQDKRSDRRSWGNDGSDSYYSHDTNMNDSFSGEMSNSSSAQSSVSGQTIKPKKLKMTKDDTENADPVVELVPEASDFQTVTNKKKIRKRHSPCDESRGRAGNSYSSHYGGKHGGRFNASFNLNDRDAIYKRRSGSVERRHTSASSPPSDKSNDSNDDLDSVHSLPGERLQASYADMARAAVLARPPPPASPPPPAPPAPVQRHRNFPDLIESCNYYSNDRLDVSTENTKNLILKDGQVDTDRNKIKSNIADAGTQVEHSPPHPIYNHEQYPALEPRAQRLSDKNNVKNKLESKLNNSVGKNIHQIPSKGDKNITSKCDSVKSCEDDDYQTQIENGTSDDMDRCLDHYVAFVKHSATNNLPHLDGDDITFLPGKLDNFISKPPDVVLPLADMNQSADNRPAVIILNEEPKVSSENIHNIDGITFGFDINEQLLNGDASSESSSVEGGGDKGAQGREPGESIKVGDTRQLRFVAPAPSAKDSYNLDKIVHYVGTAWEDIIKSPEGKVRYFGEQQ